MQPKQDNQASWWIIKVERIDIEGRRVRSEEKVYAESQADIAVVRPLRRGEKLLKVTPVKGFSAKVYDVTNRVNQNNVNLVLGECADLLDGGEQIVPSLRIQMLRTRNPKTRYYLKRVMEGIQNGLSLSKAFERNPSICDSRLSAVMQMAEQTGKLTIVFRELRDDAEYSEFVKGRFNALLWYPYALMWAMAGVLFTMGKFVMPQVLSFYKGFHAPLPWYSVPHYAVGSFVVKHQYFMVPLIILLLTGLPWYRGLFLKPKWAKRSMYDVPVLGGFKREAEMVSAISGLAVALRAGVQLVEAMVMSADLLDHTAMKKAWIAVAEDVRKGVDPAKVFDGMAVEFGDLGEELAAMVRIGNVSGNLAGKVGELATRLRTRNMQRAKDMERLFSPVITVVSFVMAAIFVLPIQVPVLRLGSIIKKH